MTFYDFSGGMESAAMLVIDRPRIDAAVCVRHADTGKQFPEMADSIRQIEAALKLHITIIPPRITFEQFLFERGGMVRKGTNDCSRRMKRGNLMAHLKTFPRPYEINLGFNFDEQERADAFVALNERDWCQWRFPLIEAGITRDATWEICRKAGFSILIAMYEKMGRFDCFWCGNQTPKQAQKVALHYPELGAEWIAAEERKGHSFMPLPLKVLTDDGPLFAASNNTSCSCFGGSDSVHEEESHATESEEGTQAQGAQAEGEGSPMKIAFDVGGVLSKYPDQFRHLLAALGSLHPVAEIEVWVVSDMHPIEKIITMLEMNQLYVRHDRVRSADYKAHGEECKAVLCRELGIDILVDDFIGYVATPGAPPIRLLLMPDASLDYYHPTWKTDGTEGNFGRRNPPESKGPGRPKVE